MIWITEWNALQHPVASAFLAVLYSDYMLTSKTDKMTCDGNEYTPSDLRKFAMSQVGFLSFYLRRIYLLDIQSYVCLSISLQQQLYEPMLLGLFKNVIKYMSDHLKSNAFFKDPTRVRQHFWRVRAT